MSIGHIDRKMRASMSIMPHRSRSVSVGHIDRKMCESVSIIFRKARASMSIIEQQPHRSRKCVHHYRASAESIVKRARQYRSSDISQGCTFVFLANILATFFPGVLAYIPKWASGARAAPSRPRRPRRDADVRSRWLMKVLKRRRYLELKGPSLQPGWY